MERGQERWVKGAMKSDREGSEGWKEKRQRKRVRDRV